jgi:hypothetical protein
MNHSWSAKIDLKSTQQVYSGSHAVAVTLTKPWGALYIGLQNGIDPARYPYFAFSIRVHYDNPILLVTLWGSEGGKSKQLPLSRATPS